jgi:enoyl-CoA hydratase/carnithine racemase
MSEYQAILTEVDGNVGILTLNKAPRHNAFDEQLIAEITEGLRELELDTRVRAVVLSSTGKSFCAGADLNWMKRAAGYSQEENLRDANRLAELMSTLNELSKPTIARVQGPAYGGGVGLIAACDIAVGTYDAVFSLSEVKLGIVPAVISPYVLAAIGERYSRRYMLTAERFSAAEAYRIGLLQDSDCQPRRNRLPRHQDGPPHGHPHRRRLFRGRCQRAPRAPRRRSRAASARPRRASPICRRQNSSTPPAHRRPGGASRLRLPLRERPFRRGLRRQRHRIHRPAGLGDPRHGFKSPRPRN